MPAERQATQRAEIEDGYTHCGHPFQLSESGYPGLKDFPDSKERGIRIRLGHRNATLPRFVIPVGTEMACLCSM
jgi:hypothetical protein